MYGLERKLHQSAKNLEKALMQLEEAIAEGQENRR